MRVQQLGCVSSGKPYHVISCAIKEHVIFRLQAAYIKPYCIYYYYYFRMLAQSYTPNLYTPPLYHNFIIPSPLFFATVSIPICFDPRIHPPVEWEHRETKTFTRKTSPPIGNLLHQHSFFCLFSKNPTMSLYHCQITSWLKSVIHYWYFLCVPCCTGCDWRINIYHN